MSGYKTIDVYEMVTNRIILELEKGNIPWLKPWYVSNSYGAYSGETGKTYSLLNQMLLGKEGEYLTIKQINERGGRVIKGEKANIIVFWKLFDNKEVDSNNKEVTKTIPYLKYYNVFHIDQCTNIEAKYHKDIKVLNDIEPIEQAEQIKIKYMQQENIDIKECYSNNAFYDIKNDYIQIPIINQYDNANEFYSTLFHEMVHSTGHKDRLNRFDDKTTITAYRGTNYSKEELVAELGTSYILHQIGIETPKTFTNSVAYIQSWLKQLKNDKKFIISAASKAEKAIHYILEK